MAIGKNLSLENKNLIAKTFGFDPRRLILLDQMQQDQILLLKEPAITLPSPLEYDALITNSPNTFLGILTADCLPIFIVDQKKKVIAAIHAGRQGTALHITAKVLKKMKEEFGCLTERPPHRHGPFHRVSVVMKSMRRSSSRNGNPFRPQEEQESGWLILLRSISLR